MKDEEENNELSSQEDIKEGEIVVLGRPTLYKPEYAAQLRGLFMEGKNVTQICADWDINRDTFYTWCKVHPEFGSEFQKHRVKLEAHVERLIWAAAMGNLKGSQGSAVAMLARNILKWDTEQSPTHINIANINSPETLSTDELKVQLAEKIKLLGIAKELDELVKKDDDNA